MKVGVAALQIRGSLELGHSEPVRLHRATRSAPLDANILFRTPAHSTLQLGSHPIRSQRPPQSAESAQFDHSNVTSCLDRYST